MHIHTQMYTHTYMYIQTYTWSEFFEEKKEEKAIKYKYK